MRIMLRTGLRDSRDPPIISLRPEVTGNKSNWGREVPIPADLVESLGERWMGNHHAGQDRPGRGITGNESRGSPGHGGTSP